MYKFLLLVCLAISYGQARACECLNYPTADEILANSKNLQRAYVYEMKTTRSRAVFFLRDIFVVKGKKRTSLSTSIHASSCGARVLVPGHVWFSFDDDGRFFNCGGVVDSNNFKVYFQLETHFLEQQWKEGKLR